MNKQFDFLRMERLAVILVNCRNFLATFFSKKVFQLTFIFIFLINVLIGQSVSFIGTPPADICSENETLFRARLSNAASGSTLSPMVWTTTNNSGEFDKPLGFNVKYTPNLVNGASRTDTIIATLDEGYPLVWQNLVGIDTTGGTFKSTINGDGNAGARSTNDYRLFSGESGWVETKITTSDELQITLGLSSSKQNNSALSIDYGIQFSRNNAAVGHEAFVIENGTPPITPISYELDDIFRIERVGDSIFYKKNREIFYKSTNRSTGTLLVDASIAIVGDELTDITVSFGDDTHIFPADTVIVQVLPAVELELAAVSELCLGDTTTIQVADLSGAPLDPTGWSASMGTIDPSTQLYTSPTTFSGNSRVVTVTAMTTDAPNGTCPAAVATVSFTIHKAPALNPAMVADNEVCEGESVRLSALPTINADTIFWTSPSGVFDPANGITNTGALAGPNFVNYFPSGALPNATRTDVVYLETDSNTPACPVARDTIEITVFQADSVYNTFEIVEICEGDSIEMEAVMTKATTGISWSRKNSVNGHFLNPSDTNAIYISRGIVDSVRFDTLFVKTIPVGTPTCDAFTDTVVVKVFEIDEVDHSFENFEICEGDSVALDAMLGGAATAVLWTNSSGNGTFITPDSLDAIYIPNDISTSDLSRIDTLIVSTIPLTNCTPATTMVEVTVHKVPKLTLSQDTTICIDDLATIRSLASRGSIDDIDSWEILDNGTRNTLSTNNPTELIYDGSATAIVFPNLTRTDTIIATVNPITLSGSDTDNQTCLAAVDTAIIMLNATADIVITTPSLKLCEEDTASVKAQIISGASGVTWKIHKGAGTITTLDSVTARYMPSDIANINQTNRFDSLMAISYGPIGCEPDTAYLEVDVRNAPKLSLIMDKVICTTVSSVSLSTTRRGPVDIDNWGVITPANGSIANNSGSGDLSVSYLPPANTTTNPRVDEIRFFTLPDPSAVCPIYADTVTVTVYPEHSVEITPPSTLEVCEGETLTGIRGRRRGSTRSMEWTSNNGVFSASTSNASSFLTNYTPNPNTGQSEAVRMDTLYLRSTNVVAGCSVQAEEMLIVKVYKATALSAVSDVVACVSSTVNLSAISIGFGDDVFWEILNAAGEFANTQEKDTTNSVQNTVVYSPAPLPNSQTQLRIDTIVYSTIDHTNATNDIICPAARDTILVLVYNAPTIEVADPTATRNTAFVCEGIGLALDGSYGGGAIGATWSVVNNQGIISNIVNDTLAVYTPNQGVLNTTRIDTLVLTANVVGGTCTNLIVTDTLFVTVQEGPFVAALEDSLTMCEGETINIAGTFGSVATGFTWSTKVTGSGDIVIGSSTNGTATYTPIGTITSPGRMDVIYLTSNNGNATCIQAIDSIEIYVSAKPTLELGPDVSMCGELTQVLTPQSTGVNNQLTWTSTDGTFANNPSPTGLYQPDFTVPIFSRPDGIIVTSIDSLGLCTAVKDTMLVTVYGLARIAIGETGTICEDDTITLNSEFAGTLNDFTYTVSNNDGVIGVNNNQLFYVPNENITQSSRVDQIVIDLGDVDGTGACPSLVDIIEVTVLNTPRSILVGDTTICAGEQVNLLTETFGLIDTFSSTYSTSLINYPSTPPTLIGGELKDTIIYGTRLINGACPADLTQIVVTIKEAGTIALNLSDTTICEANSLALDAGLSNTEGYDYQWQIVGNTGTFDARDIANPVYTPNNGLTTITRLDTIILTVVDTNNICNVGIDTLVVTVASSATLEDLRDTTICEGETLNLSATVNGVGTFFWASNSGTFADSTQQQTTYTHAPVNGGNGVDLLTANLSFANNTCTNAQKTMRVTVVGQLIVDAGKDTVICTGSTLQLGGTLGIGIDSAEWLVINNAGTFDDAKSLTAVYTPSLNTGTTDRVDVLILNSSASLNCAIPIDTMLVTVKPTPTVDIGADQMHMGTPDLILTAITAEIVEIGQWNGANGVFTNSTVNQTLYAPNDIGEGETRLDTIIYTADFGLAGCQTLSDTLVITFEAPPAIGRGADNAFCQSLCLVDTAGANIDRITGEIVVLANNLDQFDTCQVRSALDLKFWYPELGIPEPLNVMDFSGLPDSIVYDCNDRGTKNINVYVASDSMNVQLCPAVVKVDDSFLTCGERIVSGRITTFKGEPVEGFEVFVENVGTVGGVVPDPVLTDANGRYEFTLEANKEYRIIPRNDEDLAKGVTAFDNVVISRHILGLELFESPFQTIAADVNKSGLVTAFDIVLIRKVVLAREDEFQNNTSWRFIDAHYEFTDIISAAAAPFMETVLIAQNMGNVSNMDFIAVKVGDANGTVSPNNLQETESRNGAAITFQTANLPIEKEEIYEVPFQLLNTAEVAGYQFTLAFEGLELIEVKEGVALAEHFGLTLQNRGLLMSSWSTANPIATDKTWFTLRFKANKSGVLGEMLALNSSITPIEGITADQEAVGVQLNFVPPASGGFDLFQNNPNPFKNSTTIGFTLPAASTARLTILDVQGKEIQVINGGYEAGYNAVTVDLGALPKGVFYYRLETAFGAKVQKMMHLE